MEQPGQTVPVAFEVLLAHEGWMRSLARRLVDDASAADDVVQDTWLTALRSPPRTGGSVRAWLASVVRSRAADARKAQRRRRLREEVAAGVGRDHADSVPDAAAATEIHRRVAAAVLELEEPYRSAVILRFFEGLPPRELGGRLGIPTETARTRVNRGVEMLRRRLDADHGGREEWRALLVPLLAPRIGEQGSVPSAAAAGGGIMAGGKTLAASALGIALVLGLLWWLRPSGEPPTLAATDATPNPTAAPASPPHTARARTEAKALDRVDTADSAPAAASPTGARVRLRFVDAEGAPLPPEIVKVRWGAGATPSAALFDDRVLRGSTPATGILQMIRGAGDAFRRVPLEESAGQPAVHDRVPQGRWRLVVFPGGAPATISRPFTVSRDGSDVELDVVLAQTPMRPVRVVDARGAPVAGARLVSFFEFGDDRAFVAGSEVTTDASGQARLPVEDGDPRTYQRPPTWWATAPGLCGSFQVRPDPKAVPDAPFVVHLQPTFDVEGEAHLLGGGPAAGRTVLWRTKGRTIDATCDAEGRFRLPGLAAGARAEPVFLLEDPAHGLMRSESVQAKPGEVAHVKFAGGAPDAGRLLLRVTVAGRPLAGVTAMVGDKSSSTFGATSTDGMLEMAGAAAGAAPHLMVFLGDLRVNDSFKATPTSTQPLAAGEERRMNLDLPGGAVHVRVIDSAGAPVAGARVSVRPVERATPAPEGWKLTFTYGDARFADGDGAATLVGLPVGVACTVDAFDDASGRKGAATVDSGPGDRPPEVTVTMK